MINISYNEDEEMMMVKKNDDVVFYGNYWDFDDSPNGIAKFLKSLGLKIKVDKNLPSIG